MPSPDDILDEPADEIIDPVADRLLTDTADQKAAPSDDAPHPIYQASMVTTLQRGRKDPVASMRMTTRSVVQHVRDLAGAYDTLVTGKGPRVKVHGKMRELFAKAIEAITKECTWMEQVFTLATETTQAVLPVLARLGEARGMKTRSTIWHCLVLLELGFTGTEGAALVRLSPRAFANRVKRARLDLKKHPQSPWRAIRPDIGPTPAMVPAEIPDGDHEGMPTDDELDSTLLGDPLALAKWSTKELYRVASSTEKGLDDRTRFMFLNALNIAAQKEVTKETERVVEEAREANRLLPYVIDRLDHVVALWRDEIERETGLKNLGTLSIREEAKQAILGYGAIGKSVEEALKTL